MSSENVTQLIEKKRDKSSLQDLWHNGDNTIYVPEEKIIFENCFTTLPAFEIGNVDRYAIESTTLKIDQNSVSPEMINPDETKQSMDDLKMLDIEGTKNKSSVSKIQTLYPEVKEIRNAESDIKYSKIVSIQRSGEPYNDVHSEGETQSFTTFSNNETMHESLGPPKRSETHANEPQYGISKDSLVLSSETRDPSMSDQFTAQAGNRDHEQVISEVRTDENKSENKTLEAVESLMEVDEVDYYDSEDEYWNTHVVEDYAYNYVDNSHLPAYKTPSSGRYSEGLEQARNLPVFRRSIHKFAFDNNFEVHDVIPDGNCMFRAIADQLMINGFPGHTETSLRQDAITYLRSKPLKTDGGHDSSFLSGETWEGYLTRMERSREWGDHIVLQALVDVYSLQVLVFNVFQEDIRRTEVVVESDAHNEERLTVFLGHLREFHYLSLRPKNWFKQWPYKALLCRLCSTNLKSQNLKEIIKEKISKWEATTYISKGEINKISKFISGIVGRYPTTGDSSITLSRKNHFSVSLSGQNLDLGDTKDTVACLIEDPLLTDPVSGIPLPHLSIILRHLIPESLIFYISLPLHTPLTMHHYAGSFEDGTKFTRLEDLSRSQKMIDLYQTQLSPKGMVHLKSHLEATLFEDADAGSSFPFVLIDTSKTKPGYCRLIIPDDHVPETDQITLRTESGLYLEGFKTPDLPHTSETEIAAVGIRCAFSIVGMEWYIRKRQFDFPSLRLRIVILRLCCTLVQKAHHQSDNPAIEWKINFSLIESVLVRHLSKEQFYGFNIFKILLDNMMFHLERRLKTKHLKAVFFQACEEIPSVLWKSNLGGCFLFLLSKLLSCLKRRVLPHYFIPDRNLIEDISADDLDTLCVIVETVRVFPVHVSQFIANKHGITYGENLVRSILVDSISFTNTRDVVPVIDRAIPETYRTVRFLARLGSYKSAESLLESVHELSKFTSGHSVPATFYDFFNGAIRQMRQRSSRVILASMYDNRFGTKMITSYLKESEQTLGKKLPWSIDFRISWVEVPEKRADDLILIADFLYELSLNEYDKRNATLATKFIETAIMCIKKAVQEDAFDVNAIKDIKLKQEILEQKRNLKSKLKSYYIQVYNVSALHRAFHPLIDHIMDIEQFCKEFPDMTHMLCDMLTFLKMYDKTIEHAEKLQSRSSN